MDHLFLRMISNIFEFHSLTICLLVSIVDYYRVDKEDIVTGDTPETAPPALPPVAQTLPSQPLDVLFIERRGELSGYWCLYFETSTNTTLKVCPGLMN